VAAPGWSDTPYCPFSEVQFQIFIEPDEFTNKHKANDTLK
jgi:hypothetical protein